MTALWVSALLNAAVISMIATGVIWLLLRAVPGIGNASSRYAVWWVALIVVVALPLLFVPSIRSGSPPPAPMGSLTVEELAIGKLSFPAPIEPEVSPTASATAEPQLTRTNTIRSVTKVQAGWTALRNVLPIRIRTGGWLTVLLAAWISVSLALLTKLVASYWALRTSARRAISSPNVVWSNNEFLQGARVAVSDEIKTPLAIGFRNATILLPASYPSAFDAADLQRICVHEAAHLKRHDDVALLIQRVIEALLPWNPAVHWISRRLDFEREAACDEWVVHLTGEPRTYALCLTRVAELGGSTGEMLTMPTVIGRPSDLSRRIDSILAHGDGARPTLMLIRILAVTLLFGGVVMAGGRMQETVALREPVQSRNVQIQSIINDAVSAPPELSADVLLKLVEFDEIKDSKQKRQLIDDAWDLASKAVYATEFASSGGGSGILESDIGSLRSSLPGMTTEGIQSRVITQMATLDRKATRELFLKMNPPVPVFPACTENRYPVHGPYFQALGTALGTFTAEERQHGDTARFLKNSLRPPTSQDDLSLSLDLIRNSRFPDDDHVQLLEQWTESLSKASFSDRQFFAPAWLFKFVTRQAEKEAEHGRSPDKLMRALRSYFVRHAGGPRCGDGSWPPPLQESGVPVASNEDVMRVFINRTISDLHLTIPHILADEIRPNEIGDSAKIVRYLDVDPTSEIWQVMTAAKYLRFGTTQHGASILTLEQRSTQAWNAEALQYLTQLEKWFRDASQDDRGVFVMKAEFYGGLLEITPEGKLRDSVIKSYVNFLVNSPVKIQSPPEWAWWGILTLVKAEHVQDKAVWLDEIEAAGDTTISLYTRLARLGI